MALQKSAKSATATSATGSAPTATNGEKKRGPKPGSERGESLVFSVDRVKAVKRAMLEIANSPGDLTVPAVARLLKSYPEFADVQELLDGVRGAMRVGNQIRKMQKAVESLIAEGKPIKPLPQLSRKKGPRVDYAAALAD